MKKIKIVTAILLILLITMAACVKPELEEAPQVDETTQGEETTQEEETTQGEETPQVREIVDMAGRTVEIPTTIDKIYTKAPVETVYIYQLDPELLLGWNFPPNDVEKELILPEYHDLTAYGMGDSVNYESVIAANPDVVLMTYHEVNDKLHGDIEKMELSTGRPVICISDKLEDVAKTYTFLGELIGKPEEAAVLATYVEELFALIESNEIADGDKVSVYYGNGVNSLETAQIGSASAQEMDLVGVENVAVIEEQSVDRMEITGEQLLFWNPDMMVINGEPKEDVSASSAVESIMTNPNYENITAVKNGDVYAIPKSPFAWMGRPSGSNRIIGIVWLAKLAYPELYTYDLEEAVQEYYELFYHMELTAEQMESLGVIKG